ncbi:hypothetical protein ACFOZ1_01255 [Gracilibacillus marinus]|uniref:Uncharacterized protein n=1 Tax=Gracilibacillus marinus TaxID=630535 RepID=A0ABV8VTR2_9BACI
MGGWVLGPFVIKADILYMLISIVIGLIVFSSVSPFQKTQKKVLIDIVTTQLFQLVIAIIIGKIVLHLSLFVEDPIAVLAYPGDGNALYIGTMLVILYNGWKYQRTNQSWTLTLYTWSVVLLTSLFTFYFLQMTIGNHPQWLELLVSFVLLLGMIISTGKVPLSIVTYSSLILWLFLQIIFYFFVNLTFYYYSPSIIFYSSLMLLLIAMYVMEKKKGM